MMSDVNDDMIKKAIDEDRRHNEVVERTLSRIESVLVRIDERLQSFQDFVMEVTPAEARSAIAELEEELNE